MKNKETNKVNIVILNSSPFYPNSGGQENDTGTMRIQNEEFQVVNVEKVGKCVLHYLDREVKEDLVGLEVKGNVNSDRRD